MFTFADVIYPLMGAITGTTPLILSSVRSCRIYPKHQQFLFQPPHLALQGLVFRFCKLDIVFRIDILLVQFIVAVEFDLRIGVPGFCFQDRPVPVR